MSFMIDTLLKKIFGDRADEYASDPAFHDYFRELSTLSGDRLAQEPERLIEERGALQEETENLAYSNYKTFIQAANCSKQIYDEFTLIDGNVDRLLDTLPDVNDHCEQFLSEARKINSRRAGNSAALQKHSQILEILEIPQVMDTCVRAGYYEEALSLAQYATKLDRRLGYIPVVKSIMSEVIRQKELLLENLLEQLHTSLTLSQCLKVVGYCRRLNAFTEAELRTRFLLARNSWFDNLLEAIPRDDAYQHITKVMELSRVHLFDIITQYRAAFPDHDPLLLSSSLINIGGGIGSIGNEETLTSNIQALFHSWLFDRVEKFLAILDMDLTVLTKTTVSRLDSVMAQCMYFGLSFGRVGADFRELTIPIFENAVWTFFHNHVDKAYNRLSEELQKPKIISILSSSSSNLSKYSFAMETSKAEDSTETTSEGTSPSQPPSSLLEFLPLANYCNVVLSTFNEIRTCFPLTLVNKVTEKFQANMEGAAKLLVDLKMEYGQDPALLVSVERAISLLVDDLAPYLNSCLESIFPARQLAAVLGANVVEFSNMAYVGRINLDEIVMLVRGEENLPSMNDEVEIVGNVGGEENVPTIEEHTLTAEEQNVIETSNEELQI